MKDFLFLYKVIIIKSYKKMAKKSKFELQTTFSKKQADQKMLKKFNVKNVSTQRTKSCENSILFSIQNEQDVSEFEQYAKENKLDYKSL